MFVVSIILSMASDEWATERSTVTGFERGVDTSGDLHPVAWTKPRFAVVYHLLSLTHNHRLRLRVFAQGEPPHSAVGH